MERYEQFDEMSLLIGSAWIDEAHIATCYQRILSGRNPVRALLELAFQLAYARELSGELDDRPAVPLDVAKGELSAAIRSSLSAMRCRMKPFWHSLAEAAYDVRRARGIPLDYGTVN